MSDDPLRLSGTEHTVLSTLCGLRKAYGLKIVDASDGALKRASIYVLLSRLQDKGYVESEYEETPVGEQGPRRRVYRVTGLGLRVLRAREAALAVMTRGVVYE